MPPSSKQAARRSAKSKPSASRAKSKAGQSAKRQRQRSRTQALALSDAVLREPFQSAAFVNPLTIFEPLRRAMVEQQMELIGVIMAWSPPSIIAKQQAAFWEAFTSGPVKQHSRRAQSRKRAKRL